MEIRKHRIAKCCGAWMMYCPERGPDDMIYTWSFRYVLHAINEHSQCPHDTLFAPPSGRPCILE